MHVSLRLWSATRRMVWRKQLADWFASRSFYFILFFQLCVFPALWDGLANQVRATISGSTRVEQQGGGQVECAELNCCLIEEYRFWENAKQGKDELRHVSPASTLPHFTFQSSCVCFHPPSPVCLPQVSKQVA